MKNFDSAVTNGLNAAFADVNGTWGEINDHLRSLNCPTEVDWEDDEVSKLLGGDDHVYLSWRKLNGEWQVVITHFNPTMDVHDEVPILEAPAESRVNWLRRVPELFREMEIRTAEFVANARRACDDARKALAS